MSDKVTITYLNREGGGFAERHTLDAGTTVSQFLAARGINAGKETRLDFDIRGDAGIRGGFACPRGMTPVIFVRDQQRDPLFPKVERTRVVAWHVSKTYEIKGLPAGTYTVVAQCRKRESYRRVSTVETSKTVTVDAGQIAEADFILPYSLTGTRP